MENKNKYELLLKSGRGSYAKDILKLEFVYDGHIYSVGDLFDEIFKLQDELKALKQELAVKEQAQNKVDGLMTQSLDLLHKKIARVEVMLNDREEK